jgi:hypothetical protein
MSMDEPVLNITGDVIFPVVRRANKKDAYRAGAS